jgi:hypothetical protein
MNGRFKGIWKEAIMPWTRNITDIRLQGLSKTIKIFSISAFCHLVAYQYFGKETVILILQSDFV